MNIDWDETHFSTFKPPMKTSISMRNQQALTQRAYVPSYTLGFGKKDAWTSGKNAAWLKFCLNAMQCDYTRRCIGHGTLTKTHFYCLTVDFHKKLKQLLLKP